MTQFIKNFFANGMRHRFITISDGYSSNTIRRMSISPIFLLLLVCIISLFISIMGYLAAKNNIIETNTVVVQQWLDRSLGKNNPFPAPISKVKNDLTVEDILKRCLNKQRLLEESQKKLTHKLQEAETSAQVSMGRMDVLQEENKQKQAKITELEAKTEMFTELLQPRKTKGTKLVKTVFKQRKKQKIDYEITLSKGGNYPRVSRGRLLFKGITSTGKAIKLKLLDGSNIQTYNIETHAFMRGSLHWTEDVHITKVQVTHQRKEGRKYIQLEKTETDTQE